MPKWKTLTNLQRIRAFGLLQGSRKDGKLPKGQIVKVAEIFGVTRQAISLLWKNGGGTAEGTLNRSPQILKKSYRAGRPPKYNVEHIREHMRAVPLRRRKTHRSLAVALQVSKTYVTSMVKKDGFRRHSSALKPCLTEQNKVERFLYALSKVDETRATYKDMEDEIHVDEKWFYLTRDHENYIMLDDEPDPDRKVRHKSHINKVMFLAATAKPRYDFQRRMMWDGKIGIWPFAKIESAKRASINRPANTLEWKTFNVDRIAYRRMLIDNVIPATATISKRIHTITL